MPPAAADSSNKATAAHLSDDDNRAYLSKCALPAVRPDRGGASPAH